MNRSKQELIEKCIRYEDQISKQAAEIERLQEIMRRRGKSALPEMVALRAENARQQHLIDTYAEDVRVKDAEIERLHERIRNEVDHVGRLISENARLREEHGEMNEHCVRLENVVEAAKEYGDQHPVTIEALAELDDV